METKELIILQLANARKQCDEVMNAITDDQANLAPGGTANSISATYFHMLASEDRTYQVVLQSKPRILDAEGWAKKLGLPEPPAGGTVWVQVQGQTLSLLPLLGYEQVVRAATDAYLAALTPQELDRKVIVMGNERLVADTIARNIVHFSLHTGEIACIKGLMGMKGLAR